jgi:succinate dehydrogenase / fumarate reductase cytochrome b subunit
MIISGAVVLAFIFLHFYDFWLAEMTHKYVNGIVDPENTTRFHEELVHKFESPVRTGVYCVSFLLLSLHLWHGFNSSFQSVGFDNKYAKALHKLGYTFAIVVPFGFIFIALFHYFNQI